MYLGLPISNFGSPKGSRKIFLGSSLVLKRKVKSVKSAQFANFCYLSLQDVSVIHCEVYCKYMEGTPFSLKVIYERGTFFIKSGK